MDETEAAVFLAETAFPYRHVALFAGDERVSDWVGLRSDGSSDGEIRLNRSHVVVTSWGIARTQNGPITHVTDPLGPVRAMNEGDTIRTPPLTLS